MALAKGKTMVNFACDDDDLEVIDKICKDLSISRSLLIRNMIKASIDDVKVLKTVGVVDLIGLYRRSGKKTLPIMEKGLVLSS